MQGRFPRFRAPTQRHAAALQSARSRPGRAGIGDGGITRSVRSFFCLSAVYRARPRRPPACRNRAGTRPPGSAKAPATPAAQPPRPTCTVPRLTHEPRGVPCTVATLCVCPQSSCFQNLFPSGCGDLKLLISHAARAHKHEEHRRTCSPQSPVSAGTMVRTIHDVGF